MNSRIKRMVTAYSILMVCVGSSPAATRTWKNNTTGDWFTAVNWNEGAVPVAGDDVVITNTGASATLTNSTAWLSSVTLGKTLVFTNWDSALNATNVTILTNGTMKLPGTFTNNAMSNNVYIVCSNLTINAGGSINADAKGYAGGYSASGHGPGGGGKDNSVGGGGGYGGRGGTHYPDYLIMGGYPYGLADAPVAPGSGGGGRSPDQTGGAGGGAIQIVASGTVSNNGTITANGGNASGISSGGGAGGGIYITCNKLAGTNGVLRANGGNGGTASYGGSGSGGRIAVIYDQAAQSNAPVPNVTFSVYRGSATSGKYGDIGTLYFPDSRFLTENITHIGQWLGPDFTNWSVNSLTISNVWIRFPVDGFQLTVTNNMTIMGSTGRLELGNLLLTNVFQYSVGLYSPELNVGGDLTLTNSGSLYVYSGMTNTSTTNYGALVSVTNDVYIGTSCWIYAWSQWTNGGSPLFRMRNLFISTNGGFNADAKGYAGGFGTTGYGPGGGGRNGSAGGGGGYGGKGGTDLSAAGGPAYGSSNAPVDPGSGGGGRSDGQRGGEGGGAIRISASGAITLNGTITANGKSQNYITGQISSGGGAGGGIYITCRKLLGTNGVLRANGGKGGVGGYGGGGGGGRIAVWRVYDETGGTIRTNVDFGIAANSAANGTNGTVVWGWIPPAGTIIRLF